ncbi:MAG TPA: nucleotide sugar dehydrogenase [Solirubrobacteraceae bacterium]|nr:nucleotide sugar dehydrogenase [Solirubrobacteraceae bacterium]
MTPDFPLEAPVAEQVERSVQVWEGEPPLRTKLRTTPERARITRPAGRASVAVVGLSYAGLPTAMALRRAGRRVIGIDTCPSRLLEIRGGRAEVLDVAPAELRERLRDEDFVLSERLEEVQAADAVLICVPAILDAERKPSLEALKRTCAAVVAHARPGQTLVLCSAGYVGATRELLVEPLARRGLRAGEDVFVAFSPERIDPGCSAHDPLRAPRVLGAVSDGCFERAARLLEPICERVHRVCTPEAAEMAKLYESTFRAVNIALAFEIADACRAEQLDPLEVTAAAGTKPFGFMAHLPSAGVGGHGVGVDPYYLLHPLRERGLPAALAEEAMRTLVARPGRVAMRAHELLLASGRRLRDARVLVVGAAYKPGVADSCCAPAVEIISWLAAEDVQVDYHDPLVPVLRVDGEDMYSVEPDPRRDASGPGPEDYDLAIIVTLHPGLDYGWLRRCPEVLDCTYGEPTGRRYVLP